MTRTNRIGRNEGKLDCGRASYIEYQHGCRCEKCRSAMRERNRAVAAAGGKFHEWCDSDGVVEKTAQLMRESSASVMDVSKAAGVGYKWLSAIMRGERKRCRKDYADAVMRTLPSDVSPTCGPCLETKRVGGAIRALMSLGCTASEIANAAGVPASTIMKLSRDDRAKARKITIVKIERAVKDVGSKYVEWKSF